MTGWRPPGPGYDIFGGLGATGLDDVVCMLGAEANHHDGDVVARETARNGHGEGGAIHFAPAREGNPLAVHEGHAGAAHGAVERKAREGGGKGGGVDGEDVVLLIRVDAHDGDDNLDLVTHALLEGGAQRAVDLAGGEDGLGARAAFAAEERAGDTAA